MKRAIVTVLVLAGVLVFISAYLSRSKPSKLEPQLKQFVEAKRTQMTAIAQNQGAKIPLPAEDLFDAILADKWTTATNIFSQLEAPRMGASPPKRFQQVVSWVNTRLEKWGLRTSKPNALETAAWQPLAESFWAYRVRRICRAPFLDMVVSDILREIPSGSIYFGGTDAGRFAVTAVLESHTDGRPFFVLTQNQLADGGYREYASLMYSNKISILTADEGQQVFQNYLAQAQRRLTEGKLKPGENVQIVGGSVQVSGSRAVWEINALMVQTIFTQNRGREFYIEQSLPLEWTYPHLVPRGPIFQISREPLQLLPETALEANRRFWAAYCGRLIGDWITDTTSVDEVCEFAERVYARRDLNAFRGDAEYIHDSAMQEWMAKLRQASAHLYWWRCSEAKQTEEKQRMLKESLFAFKQAVALGPGNSEVISYFATLLAGMDRFAEAERVLRLGLSVNPANASLKSQLDELERKAK
jgi:hypothetical protein